jgi:hypothetical protein
MKKVFNLLWILTVLFTSCKDDDDGAIFEKTADERAAEAIANLKQELVAPANGWRIKYRPEAQSGSFYVLMDFNEDNTVNIKSDVGHNDGEFFDETVTYRIDNSLGLELIIESYSFFSFLVEEGQAAFQAEYEFNFVNKTPDEALVFNSKTDLGVPTILLFEPASPTDINLLGPTVSANISTMAADFDKFTASLNLKYEDRDLVLYLAVNDFTRTLSITAASRKINTQITQDLNFNSPYTFKGDSLVLDQSFNANVLSNNITIKSINFSAFSESPLMICDEPITLHSYAGTTSGNDKVILSTGLLDASGRNFAQSSNFFVAPNENIFNNGFRVIDQIQQDISGALAMQLYYNYNDGSGTPFNAIGFLIQNPDATTTFALREFTPTLIDNNIVFNFAPDISVFGNQNTPANIENVNIYLAALTQGDNTYVFEYADNLYEFYNPCTGWSFVFFGIN